MTRASFALLLLLGAAIRVILIATTIGTNDVVNWMAFGGIVDRVGIGPAYERVPVLNHPPLSLLILLGLEKLRAIVGIEMGDLLRLTQVVFDLIAVAALVDIGRSLEWPSPRGLALFYFLSPVSIFVSGFHGNTDPAMVSLLLIALALLLRPSPLPFVAGLAFAASIGIKIIPLLLLPLVFMWRRDRLRFTLGVALGAAVVFLPAVATGGAIVLERIFGYNTEPGNYGLAYLLYRIADDVAAGSDAHRLLVRLGSGWAAVARYTLLASIAAYAIALVLRRERTATTLLAGCGTILLIALALSPGIGMQYFLWPIAFLPFALPAIERFTVVGAFSAAQFTVYTIWSDGLPWWYADSTVSRAGIDLAAFGNLVWLVIVVVTVRAVTLTMRRAKPTAS